MATPADQLPVPTASAPARRPSTADGPAAVTTSGAAATGAGPVSLDQLLDAHWRWKGPVGGDGAPGDDDARRERARVEYDRLFRAFEAVHGVTIIDHFFGSRVRSAALLTSDARVRIRYPPELVAAVQPEFEEAVWRTTALAQRSRTLLASGSTANERAKLILAEGQHSITVYLLGVLDSLSVGSPAVNGNGRPRSAGVRLVRRRNGSFEPAPGSLDRIHRAIEAANRELDRLDDYTRLVADRAALKHYLFGLPLGVLALYLLAVAVIRTQVTDVDLEPMLVPLVTGGVGALISVMTRVSSGELNVSHTASRSLTFLAGMFRPVIGAVFGVALYVLLRGSLLPFVEVPGGEAEAFFFAGVGFLAGFSERWAQDQIVETAAAAQRSRSVRARRDSTMAPEAGSGRRRGPAR